MLLANMAVAQKLASSFPESGLLRRHEEPLGKGMVVFVEYAKKLGIVIDPSTSATLQDSLNQIPDELIRQVVRLKCIKPMKRAKYFCTGSMDIAKYHHYALNVPLYTHFTSPIRRYCDLIVHRSLFAALERKPSPYKTEGKFSSLYL